MQGKVIDGKAIADKITEEVRGEVERLKAAGITPGLAAVLVGDNPASHIYVTNKAKTCEKLGIYSEVIKRPVDLPRPVLLALVEQLNNRNDIHGILIQSPLPSHLNELEITVNISPLKDVDGFHPVNMGYMLLGSPMFLPCTPFGVLRILEEVKVDPKGKKVVILGRSNIVGKPLAAMLMQKWEGCNATVTVCHTGTRNLAEETKQADILIAAMGKPKIVTADMVREGVVIIDVGINRIDDPSAKKGYHLCGDVDYDSCLEKASLITPVPGGVGPMTIAMLMYNTVMAAKFMLQQNN